MWGSEASMLPERTVERLSVDLEGLGRRGRSKEERRVRCWRARSMVGLRRDSGMVVMVVRGGKAGEGRMKW